jgi:pimeloyl-ACP methyl ester carboxylesterase
MSSERATIVLVHGAWHGAWCWDRVMPLLEERGLSVRTVDLPSVDPAGDDRPDLTDDAAAVSAVLDAVDGPILLCGHSYGGMVITRAAAGRSDITRLVYLCAAMPDSGESGAAVFERAGITAPWLVVDDGLMSVDPEQASSVFYADCDPETQQTAVARLRRMSIAPHVEPVPVAAWRSIPSTYVVCTKDVAIPTEAQRRAFAPQADEVLELDASHSPFLSQPAAVAELLAERA